MLVHRQQILAGRDQCSDIATHQCVTDLIETVQAIGKPVQVVARGGRLGGVVAAAVGAVATQATCHARHMREQRADLAGDIQPLHQHHGNHLAGSGRLLLGGVLLMLFQRLLEHGIATLQRFQFQRGGRRTRLQLRQRRLIAAKAVLRAGKLAGFGTQLAATYERQPGSDQRPECECRHQVDQDAHGDSSKRCISCRPATRRLEADPWRVP